MYAVLAWTAADLAGETHGRIPREAVCKDAPVQPHPELEEEGAANGDERAMTPRLAFRRRRWSRERRVGKSFVWKIVYRRYR